VDYDRNFILTNDSSLWHNTPTMYLILYQDGDSEHLSAEELNNITITADDVPSRILISLQRLAITTNY
jgi:hypothetical protein